AEDVQCPIGAERLRSSHPREFSALSDTQLAMSGGGDSNELRAHLPGGAAAREQSVPVANEQVSGVEGHGHTMFNVKGVAPVAPLVCVRDVVVNERGLVKALNGDRGPAQ